jgi:predicted O-methyltransferase YrrM
MSTPDPAAANALVAMMRGYQLSQALYVAATLGIADLLADGPRECVTLAHATGTDEASLYRLLRALASRGVFAEGPDHRFSLTDAAVPLVSDLPGSVRAHLIVWGHPMQWLPWGRLLDSVRTGKPVFAQVFGMDHYDYLATHAEDAAIFRAAMAAQQAHNEVAAAYDVSTLRLIVDVGGGVGRLIAALLRANPNAQGILLDRPNVVAAASDVLRDAGVAGRCRVIGGDYFTDIPAGGDGYVFSSIMMDQDDADALTLLRACRAVMASNARIIVVERVIPAGNAPSLAHLSDLMGMVVTGGHIRSEDEFDALFTASGLRRERSVPLPSGMMVVEARPV